MPEGAEAAATGNGIAVENPATGETIATVPELGPQQVRELVAAARTAQPDWSADRPREFALFSPHQMGSCRMGTDPATSVADPRGELYDTPGVWIGDASAFPSPSGTNPMLTIMALARRTAHAVAAA